MNKTAENRQATPTASLQNVANRNTQAPPTTIPSVPVKPPPPPNPAKGFYKSPTCPNRACGSPRSEVLKIEEENGVTVKSRRCLSCSHRFKTTETGSV